MVVGGSGPVTLKVPLPPRPAMFRAQSAMSRAWMNCTRVSGLPGASTSPPRAIRAGQ